MADTKNTSITIHEQVFLDHRKQLVGQLYGQGYMLDRSMVFLASGAVGLSILLLGTLTAAPLKMPLVFCTWGCCALSLVATLTSFYFSQKSIEQDIEYQDQLNLGYKKQAREPNAWPTLVTHRLNEVALVAFVVAVLSLAWFAWCNLPM